MTELEKDFKERYGLEAFVKTLTKQSYDTTDDRDWEVNGPRYKKKETETSEHDFFDRKRFLSGRQMPMNKAAFTESRLAMEKIARYYAKKE